MTFIEAYELFGRDSMAIAEATGLSEAEAYNLMAARADRDLGIMPIPSSQIKAEDKLEQKRQWRLKSKARLAELRREARV